MGIGALTGSLAGGAGQITANLLNPCVGPERWYEGVPETMITGGIIGGLAGGAGWWIRQWVAGGQSPWRSPPFQRGVTIENQVGRSPQLPQNFPTIDRFENGVATSIKSLDLRAPSYQDLGNLSRTVQGYVDTMAAYQGQPTAWGAASPIGPGQITGRAVDLVIPASGGTAGQFSVLRQLQQYAISVGVTLNIIKIP